MSSRKDDYQQQKLLDEARKAGRAPALVDEEGNVINPHIPEYISKAPWYLNTGEPSLRHQRATKTLPSSVASAAQVKGFLETEPTGKFRKGACENCGSLTHKTKECLDRPRRVGAKWTGQDMRPDEFLQEGPQDFSGKRDRWAGFDPSEYDRVIEKHAKIEEERRRLKEADAEAELQRAIARIDDNVHPETGANAPLSDNEAEEEEKYAEAVDMPGQKVNTKTRMTVRNLRIREDTAKYLRNLDPESAFYDPKTRSMRENPNPDADAEEVHYIGDNFARLSGDTQRVTELQVFAWQASERGEEVSLQANPSEVERLYRLHLQQQETKKQKLSASLRARYGGDDSDDNDNDNDNSQDNRSLEAVDCDSNIDPVVACDESDVYIEYSKSGKVLKTSRGR